MKVALDTNAYTAFARGDDPRVVNEARRALEIGLPLMPLAELRAGFSCGKKGKDNEKALTKYLGSPRVRVLSPKEETTIQYARVFSFLRARGTPVATKLYIILFAGAHSAAAGAPPGRSRGERHRARPLLLLIRTCAV